MIAHDSRNTANHVDHSGPLTIRHSFCATRLNVYVIPAGGSAGQGSIGGSLTFLRGNCPYLDGNYHETLINMRLPAFVSDQLGTCPCRVMQRAIVPPLSDSLAAWLAVTYEDNVWHKSQKRAELSLSPPLLRFKPEPTLRWSWNIEHGLQKTSERQRMQSLHLDYASPTKYPKLPAHQTQSHKYKRAHTHTTLKAKPH